MIKIDLEHRRKVGQKVRLEAYLKSFPELGAAGDLPVDLIFAEYQVRRQFGTTAGLVILQDRKDTNGDTSKMNGGRTTRHCTRHRPRPYVDTTASLAFFHSIDVMYVASSEPGTFVHVAPRSAERNSPFCQVPIAT